MAYTYEYPRPSLTVDCVIFGWAHPELKVMLIRRGGEPFKGDWALPGGFVDMDESLERAAIRELKEETGLDLDEVFIEHLAGQQSAGVEDTEGVVGGQPVVTQTDTPARHELVNRLQIQALLLAIIAERRGTAALGKLIKAILVAPEEFALQLEIALARIPAGRPLPHEVGDRQAGIAGIRLTVVGTAM